MAIMKLPLDQGVSRHTVELLQQFGIDAVHVSAYGMEAAADDEILQGAREEGRVVVTVDSDFHAILALSNSVSPSVIRLRVTSLTSASVANLLATLVVQCAVELNRGAMITVQETRVRVRALPLIAEP
jgi:predicted nuclease of predicted toxin-antitoxin system